MSHDKNEAAPPDGFPATVPSKGSSPLWIVLTILVVVVPLLGTFNPLEVYLAGSEEAVASEGALSAGTTTTTTYLVAASLLVLALYIISGRSFPILHRRGSILLLTYLLIAFSTVLWSPEPGFTLNRCGRLVPYIGFGLVFAEYFEFNQLLRVMTRSFFIAVLCSVIITIIRPDLGLSQIGGGYENAWRGATIHKNMLGQVCSISILICSFSIALHANKILFSLLTIFISVVTLAFSQSASSALATVASLAIAASLGAVARNSLNAKVGLFAGMAVMTTLAIAIATNPEMIFSFIGRDATLTGRTYVWAAVGAAIDRSPFWGEYYGFWGIDSPARAVIWQQANFHPTHSHDSWLDVWLQLGLPGLLVLILICLVIVLSGIRLYFKSSDPAVVFSLALLVGLLVKSGPEVEFTDPFPSGLFWLALASGCLARAKAGIEASSSHPTRAAVHRATPIPGKLTAQGHSGPI
jgi:O-antigen ligase